MRRILAVPLQIAGLLPPPTVAAPILHQDRHQRTEKPQELKLAGSAPPKRRCMYWGRRCVH